VRANTETNSNTRCYTCKLQNTYQGVYIKLQNTYQRVYIKLQNTYQGVYIKLQNTYQRAIEKGAGLGLRVGVEG